MLVNINMPITLKIRVVIKSAVIAGFCALSGPTLHTARGEAMIQYFNTSWLEIASKMPELAEVGYDSMWLPPPQKGSGGLSVGYDHWDPFDFGSIDQRNTIRTRYGTEDELLYLMQVAHRFGIRIYFDNIMNHRAFDIPGYDEYTPLDVYPGMRPEDFHLRVTEEGFYRKWDNTRDWNDAWQVQNLGLADLIDIAHETPNTNFGPNEGDDHPKISFVRQPDNPEYYFDSDLPLPASNTVTHIGFTVYTFANKEPFEDIGYTNGSLVVVGAGNEKFDFEDLNSNGQHDLGEPSEPFTDTGLDPTRPGWNTTVYGYGDGIYNMGNPVSEDVGGYLIRAVAYEMDHTHADGLRLDAVKHVPDYFFGAFNDDVSDAGYLGAVQRQFNITRGFSDWDNHRDTVFDEEKPRDDAMAFGEHLGEPPGFGGYIAAGMRLVDNNLRNEMNGRLGNGFANLNGLDAESAGGFAWYVSVSHAQSHDNDYAAARELQHAFYFTRRNLPLVYTDGNYQSETLGESGGAFPRHANTAYLGQFGDNRLPNVVYIHNHFARGGQYGRWSDADVVAYDRIDKSENGSMSDADGTVLAFMMNDNFSDGQYRDIPTSFPEGAYLWNYADKYGRNDNGFYHTVQGGTISVIIPSGGYFAFSWRSPEASDLWGGNPLTIYEDGEPTDYVSYERKDGPDGDPGFNPLGVLDTNATDFAYDYFVPRVSSGTNLRFVARVDGSAINVLMKLDGGIDLNGANGRDNAPALSRDVKLGYEQANFHHRQHPERFAAVLTGSRDIIGSQGAETYITTIGSAGFSTNLGNGVHTALSRAPDFVYHDPEYTTDAGEPQFAPAPENAADSAITNWIKMGAPCQANKMFVYYTTDGSFPEGAGGEGVGATKTVEAVYDHSDSGDSNDWWKAVLPSLSNGTLLQYKVGAYAYQTGTNPPCEVAFDVPFPSSQANVDKKKQMMGVWEINGFDATTVTYYPHDDYGPTQTGLEDGFHILQARAFLERPDRASIFNTFPQTFYLDLETPQGEITFPKEGETLGSLEYGAVVRTDRTVTEVFFHIDDSDALNDDANTGQNNGNGLGTNGAPAWIAASEVSANPAINSDYPEEWRFTYRNIPSNGTASVNVRLFEISSTTNNGHYTSLSNNVFTAGPDTDVFVAYPANDGEFVNTNYVMKVYFSKDLATGLSDQDLIDRFLIKINGSAQGKDDYAITRDISDFGHPYKPGEWHELAFPMPDLFNGDINYQHLVEVTFLTVGDVTLQASRLVRASESVTGPFVEITEPKEFDSDGKPTVIELPDVASPAPEDREVAIRVETDLDAQYVWITFSTNNGFKAGGAILDEGVDTKLSGSFAVTSGTNAVWASKLNLAGTVSITESNTTLTGTGTTFSNVLKLGSALIIDTNTSLVVTQIVSDTLLHINVGYPGPSVTDVVAALQPALLSEVSTSDTIKIDTNLLTASQVLSDSNLLLTAPYPGPTASGLTAFRVDGSPLVQGSRKIWDFTWTNITQEGAYRFYAYVNTNSMDQSVTNATARRNVAVVFLDIVDDDPSDLDDDDDGILDLQEQNTFNLPPTNPETWTNWEVLAWAQFGRSDYLSPDTDQDGLPDGLEIGLRTKEITTNTDTSVDSNGDGITNFINDLDPPFYNTVPDNGCGQQPGPQYCLTGAPTPYNFSGSRTTKLGGSTTDPLNPDSDYDGLPDGVEDANHNGWQDGDGDPLPGNYDDPDARGDWPDGVLQISETWLETNPNDSDTDNDGAGDGYGEDYDLNGSIAGDTNQNRVYESGETWSETDPLNPDTDGDGLPDGWENQYALDPLDNGTNSFRTGGAGNVENGAEGNPDGDEIVMGVTTTAYINILEFQNGTNPRDPDTGEPPPEGSIVIGPGAPIGSAGGVTYYQEFTDWDADDCVVLDEYEGDGYNNQKGDVNLAYDGFDTSRDIIAFYARDGGPSGSGGDDKFYFRLDFFDLQPLAEEANLDIYIVIDTGQEGTGERVLPDEVDLLTDMRWEAVVAAYGWNVGTVYVDEDPDHNTVTHGDDLFSFGGVVARGLHDPAGGFEGSYYNSDLDSVELAISRDALFNAGWNGVADDLQYQVFTTRDGTQNSPQGAGDRGGEGDARDSIYDDYLAEDNYFAKQGIEYIFKTWFSGSDHCGRAKFASVIHGNHGIEPGQEAQNRVNNGAGAGYHRPLEIHDAFQVPVGLHVTPTLASAIEWASVDPAATNQLYRDGPALNQNVARLVATNLVDLFGSTFSDHALPYFKKDYNRDNERLARDFLEDIYETTIDTNNAVFWIPERLADADVFDKVLDMGYSHVLLDQGMHMRRWFGRETALGNDGYRLNRIDGVDCFLINDLAVEYRFNNYDNGLGLPLRRLLSRKARSGEQQQVVTIMSNWDDYESLSNANAYDVNIRWIANHQWIRPVTHEQIIRGDVDGFWFVLDRGSATGALQKVSHDFVQHASGENFDHWYDGSANEESLRNKIFDIRPGMPVPASYGHQFFGGVISQAWDDVALITDGNVSRVARSALHASTFETAFHNEDNNDLSKFSIGTYIYPDTTFDFLAGFAKEAQAQSRFAARYQHVEQWADDAWLGLLDGTVVATNLDVDLDGEDEYILENDRLFALFERIGGRMVAGWARDILHDEVYQVLGNDVSAAGSETEEEGSANVDTNGNVVAYRTSGFKDWYSTKGGGTSQYVNDLYTAAFVTNGWRFTSSDGHITKTITLAPGSRKLEAAYQLDSSDVLYVRHGLSPYLYDLLVHGQETLGDETTSAGRLWLANTSYVETVTASIGYGDDGHSTAFNPAAVDDGTNNFTTIRMRNQAQTHQVEVFGTNSFAFSLGFGSERSDWDGDGMPNTYEDDNGFDSGNPADGAEDADGDTVSNTGEYLGHTDPKPGGQNDYPQVSNVGSDSSPGVKVSFPTKSDRYYYIWYADDDISEQGWILATSNGIAGTGGTVDWYDDGTETSPHPELKTNRSYRVNTGLPP